MLKHVIDLEKSFGMPAHTSKSLCGKVFNHYKPTRRVCEICRELDDAYWKQAWDRIFSGQDKIRG